MSDFDVKSVNNPEEVRSFPKGKFEMVRVGGHAVGRGTFEPGWRWSECVKPIAKTESCEAAHVGYMVAGQMRVRMNDGTEKEFGPGDAVNIPSGHDAWIVGKESAVFIDFTAGENYAKG